MLAITLLVKGTRFLNPGGLTPEPVWLAPLLFCHESPNLKAPLYTEALCWPCQRGGGCRLWVS